MNEHGRRLARLIGADGAGRSLRPLVVAALLGRTAKESVVVVVPLALLPRGQGALAGVLVLCLLGPGVLTGPLAGARLDRTARRLGTLALDPLTSALAFGALAVGLAGGGGWWLALPALAAGATAPLAHGGTTSLLPALAPRRALPRVNALEAASFNVAAIAGPVLASAAALWAGPELALALAAGLEGTAAILLLTGVEPPRSRAPAVVRSASASLRAGVAHILRTPDLAAVTLTGAVTLAGRGVLLVSLPLLAERTLGGAAATGFLWGAFAAGAIFGALGAHRPAGSAAPLPTVLVGVAVCGALLAALPLAPALPWALALMGVAGAAYGPALAATFTVRQLSTPGELHGQVLTTSASVKPACQGLGAAAGAPFAAASGPVAGVLAAAALYGVAALAGMSVARRRQARPPPAQPAERRTTA